MGDAAAASPLAGLAAARRAWLDAAVSLLGADDRVGAVLLAGSLGRGDRHGGDGGGGDSGGGDSGGGDSGGGDGGGGDEWSDVDLVVFVGDDTVGGSGSDVLTERPSWVERFGPVLHQLDSPWNAATGAAQVNVLYELPIGLPLLVDWNLMPLDRAAVPRDTSLLFERSPGFAGVASATFDEWASGLGARPPRPMLGDVDEAWLRHAWFGMLPIAAKQCARGDRAKLVALLTGIGAAEVPEGPAAELAVIRQRFAALSPGQPDRAIAAVARLLDLVEDLVEAWTR